MPHDELDSIRKPRPASQPAVNPPRNLTGIKSFTTARGELSASPFTHSALRLAPPDMARLPLIPVVLLTFAASTHAQTFWQGDTDRPRRDSGETKSMEPPKPLSPNTILGEVIHVDAPKRLAVIRLHALPSSPDAALVARDADCTPRALLRRVPTSNASRTWAVKITHGEARPGQEVVLPEAALLKQCRESLRAHEAETPQDKAPASTPAAPEAPAAPPKRPRAVKPQGLW